MATIRSFPTHGQRQWGRYLFLCFLEFSLLLLDSLNKHLPHFFFFLLQFPHELVPLGFIGLLKTRRKRVRVLLGKLCIHYPLRTQAYTTSKCARFDWTLPEGLAVRVCVFEAHLLQFAAAVELIVTRVSLLSQVLHVHPDEHLPQLDEITVILIFHYETQGNAGGAQQAREKAERNKFRPGLTLKS